MRIDIIDTVAGFDAVRDNWDQVYRDDPDAQHFLSWTWLKDFLAHRGRWFVLLCCLFAAQVADQTR
jgi:hypothetical protein